MATRVMTAKIAGLTAYSQSRAHDEPRMEKEGPDEYDRRTWRKKAHVDKDGIILVPAMSIKWSMAEAARRLAIKIPGKRGATYSKNILSGILVTANMPIGVHVDDAFEEIVYANADGKRGSGTRVFRRFPLVDAGWTASVSVEVIDDELPERVVEQCLEEAGNTIGIGRFRPQVGGYLGRFEVLSVEWKAITPRRQAA